jgi:hypothetical protein
LRNRGVAGDLLDLQLGSSNRVATTNDPLFLAPEDTGYVYLPGVASNFMSVPDEAALDITDDIDIRVYVAPSSWAPIASPLQLIGKWVNSGNQRSFAFRIDTNGTLILQWSTDGSNTVFANSTVVVPASGGSLLWVRATLDVDNGAGTPQYEVKFYTSQDGSSWSQLGSTVTGSTGVTSIFSGSSGVELGASNVGVFNVAPSGSYYRAQIWDGIEGSGGTKVLDVDCDAITDGSATSFTAVTNQTVTINRSSGGRKSVAVPRRNGGGRSLFLLGTDDFFECVANWQHQLLNFDAQDSFTVLAVVRQWATPTGRILSKSFASSPFSGFTFVPLSNFGFRDPRSTAIFSPVGTAGEVAVMGYVVNKQNGTVSLSLNSLQNVYSSSFPSDYFVNQLSMFIGRTANSNSLHSDMEFTAAAVFRKALTPDEIKTINDYYQNRGF